MPELLRTLNSKRDREMEERKFLASLQGVNLEDQGPVVETKSFDDIKRKALGIDARSDDVVSLQGDIAAEAGFGAGAGLGYRKE